MCTGSPRLGVLRRLRPVPDPIGRRWTQPDHRAGRAATGEDRDGSRVHCRFARRRRSPTLSLRHRHGYPAALHRGLPATDIHMPTQEFPARPISGGCAPHPAHIRQVGAGEPLRDVNAGSSRTPLRHARRTRTIWQCWHVPALSGLLPPSPAPPGSGCPQLHRPAATGTAAKVSHLHSNHQRLTAHVDPGLGIERRDGANSTLVWIGSQAAPAPAMGLEYPDLLAAHHRSRTIFDVGRPSFSVTSRRSPLSGPQRR